MKALLIIFTSLMLFGCIEEGTIVYDQDYPEAPENIGGSGSGADRAPGDGAGSASGTSDGSGSTGGSSDGSGVDGGATSTGSDGSTTGGDGSGDGSTGGSTGGSTSGGTGTDGGDTSTGSSDGSGSTGGSTDGGSGSGDTGGDTGSSSTGGDTSTGSDGGETGNGSSDGSGSTGGSTDGGSGDGSTGGSADGSGSDGSGSTGSTGGTDGGTTDGSGSGSTGGSSGGTTDGAGSTGGGTGTDGGDGAGTDGGDSGSGTGDGSGTGGGDGAGDGGDGTDGGTELDAPTVTLTAKEQKIVVTWSPVDNATSYNLTWVSSDGTENIIDVSAQQVADGANPIVFAHAPLVAGQNYTYTVTAVAADGTEAVGTPLTESALALGCTPSTYEPEGLVAYYSFEGDLSDSAGSYDLTPTGDSIAYSNGCVNGKAGHFDGDGGYAYNLDFNDENVDEVADNTWSISVWANADEDMNKFASIVSTTDRQEDDWDNGFQLDVNSDRELRWFFSKTGNDPNQLNSRVKMTLGEWYHVTVTYDNGVGRLYVNGVERKNATGLDLGFNRLKLGINRFGQEPWKGFVDELMVFGETLSADEVMSIYNNTLPGTPQNATATNWVGDTVVVGWEAVEGINEYNVYYSTGGTVNENSPYITVTGGTVVNFDNLTQGQDYTYAVAGVSPLGVGELSVPTTITVDGMLLADEPAFETTVDNTINGTARKAEAIEFSPDGSKMYLIIATWTGEGSFVQYDLATTWDPRTATRTERFQFCNASLNFGNTCFTNNLKFIADGRKLIGLNDASYNGIQSSIRVWDLDVAYDISTLNSEVDYTLETYDNTRVTHPAAFAFNPEGTRMIVGGYTRMGDIGISQEWELAGSYDFSTMTKLAETDGRYFRQGTSADTHQEIIWKADGTKFIILQDEGSVRTYNVSVPFELSSSVYGTESALTLDKEVIKFPYQSVRAIHFSPAQDRLYYVKDEADGTVTIGSMPFSW